MKIEHTNWSDKPKDWPANEHEFILDRLCDCIEEFRQAPSYKTREVLLAQISQHDLNQSVGRGLVRVTEYEVQMINTLYLAASYYNINALKTYLYDVITQVTRLHIISALCAPAEVSDSLDILPYEKALVWPLRLYYLVYHKYTIEKEKRFAEQLIEVITTAANLCNTKDHLNSVVHGYSSMITDISHLHGRKRERMWEFTREELFIIFQLEARLMKWNHQPANIRPTKGILMIQISNFILKSRHGYNKDYICKYLPEDTAEKSIINHQIWMKKTVLLNDEREQRVVPELFQDPSWIKYDWIKDIDFTATRTYYVSSFSKSVDNKKMSSEYGKCLYGYKNDRIADLIAPIQMRKLVKKDGVVSSDPDVIESPSLSQVIEFDVIYDEEEAKEELQYLFSIIDMFSLSNVEKKAFLQEILQYWILSVKDSQWAYERERRYVLFLYDDYKYKEIETDATFLKVKTSLFLTPDFILGDNPSRNEIERQLEAKRSALYSREYLLCENCLMQDYDLMGYPKTKKCPICGSDRIRIVSMEPYLH